MLLLSCFVAAPDPDRVSTCGTVQTAPIPQVSVQGSAVFQSCVLSARVHDQNLLFAANRSKQSFCETSVGSNTLYLSLFGISPRAINIPSFARVRSCNRIVKAFISSTLTLLYPSA